MYKKRSTYRRCCWYVHPEVLVRHSQESLPVPCQWTYLTSGAQITRDEHAGSQGNSPTMSSSSTPSNKRKSTSSHSITKYMKKSEQVQCRRVLFFFFLSTCLLLTLLFVTQQLQTETMETDGFQADTEDDEDDDCIIIGEQSGWYMLLIKLYNKHKSARISLITVFFRLGSSEQDANTSLQQTERNPEPMDTNASETAALASPCLTPATAWDLTPSCWVCLHVNQTLKDPSIKGPQIESFVSSSLSGGLLDGVQFFIGEVPLFESSAGTFIGSETNQVDAVCWAQCLAPCFKSLYIFSIQNTWTGVCLSKIMTIEIYCTFIFHFCLFVSFFHPIVTL